MRLQFAAIAILIFFACFAVRIVDFSVKPLRGRTNVKLQFAPSRYADGPFQSIATITMKDNVGVVQVVRIPVDGWVLASDSSNSSN